MKMTKMIVNNPEGIQEVIRVGEGGGYFDQSRVVWDERVDGELSESDLAKVGGLSKNGNSLDFDPSIKSLNDGKKQAKKDAEDQGITKVLNAKAKLKDNSATLEEKVNAVIDYLGLGE